MPPTWDAETSEMRTWTVLTYFIHWRLPGPSLFVSLLHSQPPFLLGVVSFKHCYFMPYNDSRFSRNLDSHWPVCCSLLEHTPLLHLSIDAIADAFCSLRGVKGFHDSTKGTYLLREFPLANKVPSRDFLTNCWLACQFLRTMTCIEFVTQQSEVEKSLSFAQKPSYK